MSFHETRFPTAIAFHSSGGPERRTEIVVLGSGFEERNAVWANSRRRYDVGYGVKSLADLHEIIAFFEARRGRLHAFRFRDFADCKSCAPTAAPTPRDQALGTGDGETTTFQLVKTYGAGTNPWTRTINKPVAEALRVAVDGEEQSEGWSVDPTTGLVTFDTPPASDAALTTGFEFDTPVRFDTDALHINLANFNAGEIPSIPLVEVLL